MGTSQVVTLVRRIAQCQGGLPSWEEPRLVGQIATCPEWWNPASSLTPQSILINGFFFLLGLWIKLPKSHSISLLTRHTHTRRGGQGHGDPIYTQYWAYDNNNNKFANEPFFWSLLPTVVIKLNARRNFRYRDSFNQRLFKFGGGGGVSSGPAPLPPRVGVVFWPEASNIWTPRWCSRFPQGGFTLKVFF